MEDRQNEDENSHTRIAKSIVVKHFCTYFMFLCHFMYVKSLTLFKDLKTVNANSHKHWNAIRFYANTLRLMMAGK
jgi:hypothetical protein